LVLEVVQFDLTILRFYVIAKYYQPMIVHASFMILRNILDFSSVHENLTELEAAIALCCNNNKVLSF